ncbi:hypothetical protein SEPCBS119000_005238, partial [Sporothrix epigloea]
MLFSLDDIDSVPEDQLCQKEETCTEDEMFESICPLAERSDGEADICTPRYLCIAQPLTAFVKHTAGFKIKLSDMGG